MPTILKAALATLGLPAAAAEWGAGGQGRVTVHCETGQTGLTAEHTAHLAEFAETAKSKTVVCVLAQVDAQGTEAANREVAEGRARNVSAFLQSQSVPADRIAIAKTGKAFTLFDLLGDDRKSDRRVSVSYE